jgi:uncharacterized protein (TIGR02996 family)
MSTAEAFLRDILDNPEDDTPRLVFADWLDEHGQPHRAEFIRLQVEQARLPRCASRYRELDERASALRTTHAKTWDSQLRQLGRGWKYRRGFIQRVTFRRGVDFVRAASRLFDLAPVQRVEIEVPWFRFASWSRCPQLVRLHGLKLNRFGTRKWDVDSLRQVLSPPTLAGLTELNLDSNFFLGADWARALKSASHLDRLRVLNLMGNGIGAQGVRILCSAGHLATLEALDLGGNDVGARGLADLAAAPLFAGLRDLRLGRDEEFSDHGNDVGDEGVRALVSSPHLKHLRVLDLSGNGITDDGAALLSEWSSLAGIEWLDLSDNAITDDGAKALASARGATGLRGLSLYLNEVGSEGIRALLDSPCLASLAEFCFHQEGELPPGLWQAVKKRFGEGLNDYGYWGPPEPE